MKTFKLVKKNDKKEPAATVMFLSWLVNPPPPEIRPSDQGLLTIGSLNKAET